jgi:trigger factor
MKAVVTPAEQSTVHLSVELTPDEMAKHYDAVVRDLARQVSVKGFRKGKVPRAVLEQRFGAEYIAGQVLERAVSMSYYDAVTEHKLQPVAHPQTTLPDNRSQLDQTGLSYTAIVPVLPEIKLGDYQAVRVKPTPSEYKPELVDEAIEEIRKGQATFTDVDRPAQPGDRVEIDFVGSRKGVEVEGAKSENHPLIIGEDNLIPGFSDQLKKMRTGQVKTFKIRFPKEYHEKSLAGEKVEFTVTMKRLQERVLPALDDAFAKQLGVASLDELREKLSDNLQEEKRQEARRRTEDAVLEAVLGKAKVEVPQALIDEEAHRMVHEIERSAQAQGIPFEKYLEHLGKTHDELAHEQIGEAQQRVKTAFVLNEIAQEEKVAADSTVVQLEIDRQLAQATPEQREKIETDEFRRSVERAVRNQAVIDSLVTRATE